MSDPVSWKFLEPGWHVLDAAGERIATIDEIMGDPDADTFDGIAVGQGTLTHARFVPAANVGEIRDDEVQLTLSRDEVEQLEEYVEPEPEEKVIPADAGWLQRLAWRMTSK